jgi:hypothetical protein
VATLQVIDCRINRRTAPAPEEDESR